MQECQAVTGFKGAADQTSLEALVLMGGTISLSRGLLQLLRLLIIRVDQFFYLAIRVGST
jgi:hypothetical protein